MEMKGLHELCIVKEDGKLGFGVQHLNNTFAAVSSIQAGSSAEKAGLCVGDVLLMCNDMDLSKLHFLQIVQSLKVLPEGQRIILKVSRYDGGYEFSNAQYTMNNMENFKFERENIQPQGRNQNSIYRNPNYNSNLIQNTVQQMPNIDDVNKNINTALINFSGGHKEISFDTALLAQSSSEPPAKKPKTVMMSGMEYGYKKTIDTLTKELEKEKNEKQVLSDRNAKLRKRVQEMIIGADEVKLKLQTEFNQTKTDMLKQINQLQVQVAESKAKLRIQERIAPDATAQEGMKAQLEELKRQLDLKEELEHKKKEARRIHAVVDGKNTGMCV